MQKENYNIDANYFLPNMKCNVCSGKIIYLYRGNHNAYIKCENISCINGNEWKEYSLLNMISIYVEANKNNTYNVECSEELENGEISGPTWLFRNKEKDSVVHPSHYNWIPDIECMDVVKYFDFPVGNVIKYCWRAGYKSTSTKLEDLKKARYYIDIAIEMEENDKSD